MSRSFDFDEEQYQAFKKRLEQDFKITLLVEIDSGYSGARTFLVHIESRHPGTTRIEHGYSGARTFLVHIESRHPGATYIEKGKYILKVCRREEAEQEIKNHKAAKESSILREYIPDLIEPPIRYDDTAIPLMGILYQIAGESLLRRTTLRRSLEHRHFSAQQVEKLARVMLTWNFETTPIKGTSDLLGSMLEEIGEEHLTELEERVQGIGEHLDRSRIDLTPLESSMYYNPIHFLRNRERDRVLRQMPYVIPLGMLHGDLHPGNVIISKEDQEKESFHIIDFAALHSGNVFFDLAYLEISILLNSRGGFHRMVDLEDWWELEQYLISEHFPSERKFRGASIEELRRVLPIRRALDERIKQDGKRFKDDYWIAFLVASVEAGLDLARKVSHDRFLQRVAFLTATSRFHYLIESLEAFKIPLKGQSAAIHWPGEEPPPNEEQEVARPTPSEVSTDKRRAKIDLVWPGEITQRAALYDPWGIVDGIWNELSGTSDQGVLLIGERRFGKSSFFNSVSSLFPRTGGNLRAVRLDTLGHHHSAQSFATEVMEKLCQSIGLRASPLPFDNRGKEFDSGAFFLAFQSVIDKKKRMRFVVCIDEIDSTLANAVSREDAKAILQMLYKLLTSPVLPVRLLLTAANSEVLGLLREYRSGTGFVENLGIWKIPLCSELEMRELIECFDVPVSFEEEALSNIFQYSGGQIYFVKLAIRLIIEAGRVQAAGKDGKKLVNAQMVDSLMHAVITPTSTTPFTIRNIHEVVFNTMRNIYPLFFSKEEQQFLRLLTEANGTLKAASLQVSEAQLVNVADGLHQRGYISKTVTKEDEAYSWRIGIWQLFLESHYQLKYHKSQKKQ